MRDMKKSLKIIFVMLCATFFCFIFTSKVNAEQNNVYFGTYYQSKVTSTTLIDVLKECTFTDNVTTYNGVSYIRSNNGYYRKDPIEWIVLDEEDGYYTLLSKYVLECRAFNDLGDSSYFWQNSTIRSWLNTTFYNTAFSDNEQADMQKAKISTWYYPYDDAYINHNPGSFSITWENVYLLDESEVPTGDARIAHTSQYVNVTQPISNQWLRGSASWSYGNLQNCYLDDSEAGQICYWYGTYSRGIRPVICVNKTSSHLSEAQPNVTNYMTNFTEGKDNNSYKHALDPAVSGFTSADKKTDYTVTGEYYKALTKDLSKDDIAQLNENMHRKWTGSCFGIVSTMAYVYNKRISLNQISDNDNGTYYSMEIPRKHKKLLNNINYYQLTMDIDSLGHFDDATMCKYVWMSSSEQWWTNIFLKLDPEIYDPSVVLKNVVKHVKNACEADKVLILGYNDHSILTTGYKYDTKNKKHIIYCYDPNETIDGDYNTRLEIEEDYSSGTLYSMRGEKKKISKSIFLGGKITSMKLIDPAKLGVFKSNQVKTQSTSYDSSNYANVEYLEGSSFRITNSEGKTLTVHDVNDAEEKGPFSGNLTIEDMDNKTVGGKVYITLTVDASDTFTIDNVAGIASYESIYGESSINDCGTLQVRGEDADLDISISCNGKYMSLTAADVKSVVFDTKTGMEITPKTSETLNYDAYAQLDTSDSSCVDITGSSADQITISSDSQIMTVEGNDINLDEATCYENGGILAITSVKKEDGKCIINASEAIEALKKKDETQQPGATTQPTNQPTTTATKLAKPSAPTLAYTGNGVQITWGAVDGATGYYVYREGYTTIRYAAQSKIAAVQGLSYIDNVAYNGCAFAYRICAYNANGVSDMSDSRVIYCLNPPTIKKLTNKKAKTLVITWGKPGKNVISSGYQVQYSLNKNFKNAKTVTVNGGNKVSKTIKKVKKGKTYFVRMRVFTNLAGVRYNSGWSKVKKVKIKK